MHPVLIITPCVVAFCAIIFFVWYFSKKPVVKRNLKKAVGKKIGQFLNGDIAKVVGTVEFVGEPLLAPLSKRSCAYYYVLVEQHVSSGKNSHWKKIIEEEVSGKFVIRDGRHSALIDGSHVKSYIVQDKTYNSGFLNDAKTHLEVYLRKHGIDSTGLFGLNKTIRYKEGVLEKGELIAVVGIGEWRAPQELELPESFGKILQITSTDEQPIYLSDDPETVKVTYSEESYYTR
jgi:hypothetical protein